MRGTTDEDLEQLRAGMAWWYRKYAKEQIDEDRESYAAAELEARNRAIGLWNDTKPVLPWVWRKNYLK
jgi:endonuclease YncB( thermonuclease family)